MDYAPLNLAHFHERRANRFLNHQRYDDAYKAMETSLIYLQDAFKSALMPKSVELLNTQKWEYQRKLSQIQMHKQEQENLKHKEIVPLSGTTTNTPVLFRTDSNLTAQSVAKSIDRTVRDFDSKLNISPIKRTSSRENKDFRITYTSAEGHSTPKMLVKISAPITKPLYQRDAERPAFYITDSDELPSLTPLELPSFEYHSYSASNSSLTNFTANLHKE